jgi:predicted transposase YbfD/YdcC
VERLPVLFTEDTMADQVIAHVSDMIEHFAELPDPRSTINQHHPLVEVIVMAVCGVLSGADGPTDIEEWACCHREWLQQHLTLPYGIPSHDTFRRVLQRLPPQAFQRCFAAWLQSLVGAEGVTHLAIDGKTLRGSRDERRQLGALHLVSVWAAEHRLTLGQIATAEKSNEITAIPQVLELVDVKGAVVTIDAMGCQKAIAEKVVALGGDYVLPVKGNQGNLEGAIGEVFDEHLEKDFARVAVSQLEEEQQHHGRKEHRTYIQINVPASLAGREEWSGLKTLGMVIRTREVGGQETGEVQYYISSLKRNVKRFAQVVRGHWGIENTCHWSLDVTFREDDHRTRERNVAENLAWLRRFALGLLKQHPEKRTSLVMKRRKCGWSTAFLTEVLFGKGK